MEDGKNDICDHCDRVKETDERFDRLQTIVDAQGCKSSNDALTACLNKSRNRWQDCREEVSLLKVCVEKAKESK